MAKRDFVTPSSVPETTTGRCITVPNDAAWLGLLNAALLMLTEQWRYLQIEETDLTPEETAAVWYDIYVASLTSNCEECPDMNCNDVLACVMPYLQASVYDGAALRLDPVTDEPQVSYDGGTTWTDIPQAGDGSIVAPQPTPTIGADDAAKICLASTRAALVIAEFYKQTFGAFTADVMNALGTANSFLQDVKLLLFNAIYSPYDGVLEAAGFLEQDFETNYTAGELSPANLEDLICLLVASASIDSESIVTFDYGAVRDNVIADVGTNPGTAVWFLLGNMQQAGLNASGSVAITDTGDCEGCGTWSHTFDFTTDAHGFVANTNYGGCNATRNANGWNTCATADWNMYPYRVWTPDVVAHITRIECVVRPWSATTAERSPGAFLEVRETNVSSILSADINFPGNTSDIVTGIDVDFDSLDYVGVPMPLTASSGAWLRSITVYGDGANPFE